MSKASLLASACALSVLSAFALPASAQTSASPQAGANEASTVGEVVVTAQRRSELQRDVPIAITSVTAQQMQAASVQQLGDLPG